MSSRVTFKMVQEWLKDSAFGQLHGCRLITKNGYYTILTDKFDILCDGGTPLQCWRNFNLIKEGWYMHERETAKNS